MLILGFDIMLGNYCKWKYIFDNQFKKYIYIIMILKNQRVNYDMEPHFLIIEILILISSHASLKKRKKKSNLQ